MKTWDQLTGRERERAVAAVQTSIYETINETEYAHWQQYFGLEVADAITKAVEKADRLHTPWFVNSYIFDECGDALFRQALAEATGYLYSEDHDLPVIDGVCGEGE